jgi:hypothetical protein
VPQGSQGERLEVLPAGVAGLLPRLLPAGADLLQGQVRLERMLRMVLLRPLQPARITAGRVRGMRPGTGCEPLPVQAGSEEVQHRQGTRGRLL